MAIKKYFYVDAINNHWYEDYCDYIYNPGFSLVQKEKNIIAIHESIKKKYKKYNILEISTKSIIC